MFRAFLAATLIVAAFQFQDLQGAAAARHDPALRQAEPESRLVRIAQSRISPSQAVAAALAAVPGSKPLGVSLRGGNYVVRVKTAGGVQLVRVDAATGAVVGF